MFSNKKSFFFKFNIGRYVFQEQKRYVFRYFKEENGKHWYDFVFVAPGKSLK